jgi:hypothetical protein
MLSRFEPLPKPVGDLPGLNLRSLQYERYDFPTVALIDLVQFGLTRLKPLAKFSYCLNMVVQIDTVGK